MRVLLHHHVSFSCYFLLALQPLLCILLVNAIEIKNNNPDATTTTTNNNNDNHHHYSHTKDGSNNNNNDESRRSLLGDNTITWDSDAYAETGRENPRHTVDWVINEQKLQTFVLTEFLGIPGELTFEDLVVAGDVYERIYNDLAPCSTSNSAGTTDNRLMTITLVQVLPTEFDGAGDSSGVGGGPGNNLGHASPVAFTYLARIEFVCKGCFPDSFTLFKKNPRDRTIGTDIELWNECIPENKEFLAEFSMAIQELNTGFVEALSTTEVQPQKGTDECLVTDNFESDLLMAVQGDEALVTDEDLVTFEQAAVEAYNELNALDSTVCDTSSHIATEALASIVVNETAQIAAAEIFEKEGGYYYNTRGDYENRDSYRQERIIDIDRTTTSTTRTGHQRGDDDNDNNNNYYSSSATTASDKDNNNNDDDIRDRTSTAGRNHNTRRLKVFTVDGVTSYFRVIDDLQEFRDMAAHRRKLQQQDNEDDNDERRLDDSWFYIWLIVYGSCNGCPEEDCLLNDVQGHSECDRRRHKRRLLRHDNQYKNKNNEDYEYYNKEEEEEETLIRKTHRKVRIKQLQKRRQEKFYKHANTRSKSDNNDNNKQVMINHQNDNDNNDNNQEYRRLQFSNYAETGCLCSPDAGEIQYQLPRTDDFVSMLGDTIQLLGEESTLTSITGVVYVAEVNDQMNDIMPPESCCGYPTDMNTAVTDEQFQEAIALYMEGSIENAGTMFGYPINCWDVSQVTDFSKAFEAYPEFNERLDCWKTENAITMNSMFKYSREFDQKINNWKVDNVIDMSAMFFEARVFNRRLDRWNVVSVQDMSYMFGGALEFNRPLDTWQVNSLLNAESMFDGARIFNQDLCNIFLETGLMLETTLNMFRNTACNFPDDPIPGVGPFCFQCV